MTRLLVLSALTLTVLFWSCGGSEKPTVQSEPVTVPGIPDSIKNKPKLPLEMNGWRLLTFKKDGVEQKIAGPDSTHVTINFEYGRASGSLGCNSFQISCALDSTGMIQFGDDLNQSNLLCMGLMGQEDFLKKTIFSATTYVLNPSRRHFELISGDVKMLFVATVPKSKDNSVMIVN